MTVGPADTLAVGQRHEQRVLAGVLRAAMDPGVDVAKMQALIAMHQQLQDREARQEFNSAMVAAQREMPRIGKDGLVVNHKTGAVQSRYATLENLDKAIRPVYERHGFSVSFNTGAQAGAKLEILARVRHGAGHQEDYRMPLELDTSGAKNGTQGAGSTFSYGRRYLLKAIFNIVEEGEDRDGAAAATITDGQVASIETMIADTRSNLSMFLRIFNIEKLAEMPAERFRDAMAALEQKRRAMEAAR